MALDALNNLVNNVPDWQQRLEDLGGQIERRQAELAAVAAVDPTAETKSLRNKGSTESLRPRDDAPSHSSPNPNDLTSPTFEQLDEEPAAPGHDLPAQDATATNLSPGGRSALHKQAREAVVAAHARVRVQVKRRQRSSSLASADGPPPVYRTRSMIIVYYDSYVQSFFDDLVRYISSSRNLMRKAKMAAKVAEIKRMAERETSGDGEDGENGTARDTLPSLRYMTTSRFGLQADLRQYGTGGPDGTKRLQDIYDKLDTGLEFVQSTCEHGAHQFLRDANCNEEITKIRTRLGEVREMAKTELERVLREEPELAKETGDQGKIRTRRPISMRREMSTAHKDGQGSGTEELAKLEIPSPGQISNLGPSQYLQHLEVDTNLDENDGDLNLEEILPRLQYRSTRAMRNKPS